jgi:acyl-CoA dehydrogenase
MRLIESRIDTGSASYAENQAAYEAMVATLRERQQIAIDGGHGRERKAFGGHLFDLGAIRQRMAMNQAKVDAVRASMYHAAWMHDAGQDNVKAMSGVKAWGCEVVNQVMYDCVQFHGGMGYMRESAIERMYRDARILPIGGGATEVMLEEVAKRSYG